jgi:Zn-dependent protease
MPDLAAGLAYYVAFLFSTTLHEASHAWAALRGGDPTAYHGGQVSLDPWPHIRREPIGMVLLPLISVVASGWPIGFASAPFDPHWAMRYPRRAAWMALAGPAANFSLVLLAAAGILFGLHAGVLDAPDAVNFDHVVVAANPATMWRGIAFMLSVVFSLNLLLATFNLFPVPPLDGSGAVPLFVGVETGRRYQEFIRSQPAFSFLGLVLAWKCFDYVFHPIWLLAVNLVHPLAHYGG